MAFTTTHARHTTGQPAVCPTCGGLQCFERPRYFCGQLTDKDLDAAQRYVIEKNRLHNRYLVGTGVVCGLAVRCHHCDDTSVIVEPGYAIDCCGNDIVLCDPAPFDVIEYLERCRREEEPDCYGKRPRHPSRCDDLPQEYGLILSYNEQHARPITALIRDQGCTVNRCEPSRTQEIFRLDLVRKEDYEKQALEPDFWKKATACVTEVISQARQFVTEIVQAAPLANQNLRLFHDTVFGIFCRMKSYVLKLYKTGPNIRCSLIDELCEIEERFPAFTDDPDRRADYLRQIYTALFRMFAWMFQYLLDCICDALLVPCRACDDQTGVLLACLTVEKDKVTSICNIVRQQIVSGPARHYWLNPLSVGLSNLLEFLCCGLDLTTAFERVFQPGAAGFTAMHGMFNRGAAAFKMGRDFATPAWTNLQTFNFVRFINPETTIIAMDVYDLTTADARRVLAARGVMEVVERQLNTNEEAYALQRLAEMDWLIPPRSRVELIATPTGRVTCIRVIDAANAGGTQ